MTAITRRNICYNVHNERKAVIKMLTPLRERFCLEYAACGNATEAYIKAGFVTKKKSSATVKASQLLKKPEIQARLQELAAELKQTKIADVIECQEILTSIARNKDADNADRIKAIQTLLKVQGAFVTKINLQTTPIVISGGEQLED